MRHVSDLPLDQQERKRARDRNRVLTPEQIERKKQTHREWKTWQGAHVYYLRYLDRLEDEQGASFPGPVTPRPTKKVSA